MYYSEAKAILDESRNKNSKKLESNTYLKRHEDESIGVRLHDTDVINLYPDGSFRLNTGGWETVTTKDRIVNYIPNCGVRLFSERGVWLLANQKDCFVYQFIDGILIEADGTFSEKYPARPFIAGALSKMTPYSLENKDDVIEALKMLPLDTLKKLWRKCPLERLAIATYAPLDFMPLIINRNTKDSYSWRDVAKKRLANGV